ncbi:1-acyl-sn-glycerol-3-phosphate acyltransferase [Pseudoluteimonas lycopersici]|uniref:1-acyl-sn-glycerol-3-phosphate acyltransferase n=1 Tax=Pseudoluteimonas lycopersici TaxID=1324796 RepID=A0A516V7N2_9GAMM|nr:lysophospholipid acyltransferase family protein [Lysobacter lycopersici]QDQ74535.1 1-acyl-sn-glycerol-3-phosphate acyltransferase [Lysobacter lycopersici]
MSATSLPARRTHWPARVGWVALNALQALFTILVTVAGFPVALLLGLLSGPRLPLRMAALYWAPLLFLGAGARLRVEGAERVDWSRPQVLVANHASMIDIPALFRAVPVPLRFVLKREIAGVPFVGWYARFMGMAFIDRGNAREAKRKLAEAAEKLRGAATFAAFPEGTRSKDGTVGPFKGGALQLALEAGVPVLPVAIAGAGSVLPPSGFSVRPGTIVVRFGDPIETAGMAPQDRNALAQRARDAVLALHDAR